jgi:hypothetical protein
MWDKEGSITRRPTIPKQNGEGVGAGAREKGWNRSASNFGGGSGHSTAGWKRTMM